MYGFYSEDLQSGLLSISIDPESGKQDPSYRILMPVRQCTGWFVLHMLPHWLFITAAHYEKRLHPSPTSNEFLHADSIQGPGFSNGLSLKKDKDWAAIIAYYVTALQDWMRLMWDGGWEKDGGCRGYQHSVQPRNLSLELTPQPAGTVPDQWWGFFHMVAQTNALPLKCRQQSWCELCMCTNELCCRMLLWWLPSLLGIDPGRVKTGRKERKATNNSSRTAWHSTVARHRVQGLFRDVLSKSWGL